MNNKLLFYCLGVIAVYLMVILVKSKNDEKKNKKSDSDDKAKPSTDNASTVETGSAISVPK